MLGVTLGIGLPILLLLLLILLLLLLARRHKKRQPVEEAIYENTPADPQTNKEHYERQLKRLEAIALAPPVVPPPVVEPPPPIAPRGRMSAAWAGSSAFWVCVLLHLEND